MALDAGGDNTVYGIRVLNTADGSVVSATNGAAVQSLTNLDFLHQYTCAAWDNVGNLYGASPTPLYRWRVWSPPGPNTATTAAVARIVVPTAFAITSVTASPGSFGCAIVTITFTAPGNLDPPAFTLMGAATVNGAYTPVAGASVTGGAGVYQATATVCSSAQFFEIGQN
jgi:hypothetical protein